MPEYGTDDVAEHALALLLACARRIAASDRAVQAGGWPSFAELGPMRRLGGSTLGLIGFSRIARALDVLDREPPAPGSAILHRANVLITPHSAAFTREALEDVRRTALADVLRVLSGEPPLFPVPGLAADGAELVQSQRRSGQDEQAGETR